MRKITPTEADAVWTILVKQAGAYDGRGDRESFIWHVADSDHPCREYRFGGKLNWGGKFRNNGNRNNTPYVDCYPEHMSPENAEIIERTNAALAALFAEPAP